MTIDLPDDVAERLAREPDPEQFLIEAVRRLLRAETAKAAAPLSFRRRLDDLELLASMQRRLARDAHANPV
jgi:hypothetical protein